MLPPPAPTFLTATDDRPGDVAGEHRAQPRLARELDVAVAHDADVEAGAAGVADDEVAGRMAATRAGDRRHRRSRVDRVQRPLGHVVEPQDPAERRDEQQLSAKAVGPQIGLHLERWRCISGLSDASIAADEVRRYSRMIGFSRDDSVYGTPGSSVSISSPISCSCAAFSIDHSSDDGDRLDVGARAARRGRPGPRRRSSGRRISPSELIRSSTSKVSSRGMYGSG